MSDNQGHTALLQHLRTDERSLRFIFDFAKNIRNHSEDELENFLVFCARNAPSSFSQVFQDLWVLWECRQNETGYFVEFGAADGVKLSNTYLLEKTYGWRGIVAEPNRSFIESVRKQRSCHVSDKCVFSRTGEEVSFVEARSGTLSRIKDIVPEDGHESDGSREIGSKEYKVQTISLNDLLANYNAPREIQYLSIDTEGSEFEILEKLDFDKWCIKCITVEHNYTYLRDKIHELLTSRGFVRKWEAFSRFDDFYLRS